MIAVFGAGAIGCWLGGRLAAGGADVVLLGRPRVLDELARGLTLTELDGPPRRLEVRAASEPPGPAGTVRVTTEAAAAGRAALVLVTVKSAQTAEAARDARDRPGAAARSSSACRTASRNAEVLRAALPGHARARRHGPVERDPPRPRRLPPRLVGRADGRRRRPRPRR